MDGADRHEDDLLLMITPGQRFGMRATVALAVSGVTVLVAAPGALSVAIEQGCATFEAVAASDGVRTAYTSKEVPLVTTADVQGPAAQGAVNSLGLSTAYAGLPYPGDSLLSLVALGTNPDAIPTYIRTQYPAKQKQDASFAATALTASSQERESKASASGPGGSADGAVAAGANSATAVARCDEKGVVESVATTNAEALSFAAGTVRLASVRSHASARVASGAKTELSSSVSVRGLTVAGQHVEITDGELVYPGGEQVRPADPLAQVLSSVGVTITVVGAQADEDGAGVMSAGLRVSTTRELSSGTTRITYTFGRAYARASGDASPLALPTSPSSSGSAEATPGNVADRHQSDDGATSLLGPLSVPQSGDVPVASSTVPDVAIPEAANAGDDVDSTPAAMFGPPALPLAGLYLSLVAGAAAVLTVATLIRLLGVRLSWM